jgi:hypothetical protein
MSNTFEFEEESDREFHEFQEQEFQESEWEAEYGRRRWQPRMARRLPARPFRPVKRPLAVKRPFAVRPRRPGGPRYVPIFPIIPWSVGPADQPPVMPASPPFAEPPMDATTDTTTDTIWPGDAAPQDAPADTASAPGDAASSDAPPPAEPASTDQPQGESSRVRWSQDALNRALGLELETSGLLNAPTRSAIRTLQRQAGLPAHGQLDRATASALRQRAGSTLANDASTAKPSCGCASCRRQASG